MLTAIEVRNAKSKDKPFKLTDGKGLYLYIAPSGMKTWRYRYTISGKESTYVIGEYPIISLEAARKERAEIREKVKAGINLSEERKQQKQAAIEAKEEERNLAANSFETVAYEWHHYRQARWSAGYAKSNLAKLTGNVFPAIGVIPIDQVTPPMVLKIIRAVESRGAGETAKKCLEIMNGVFRYAIQTGRATYNPAADMRGVLISRKVVHHPMIKPAELPEFLQALTKSDIHTTTKLALQFTILTAARSGEVRGATWAEIDLEKRLWIIPAERMKMKAAHAVPLSKQTVAILNRLKILHGNQPLVFPGVHYPEKPLSENTMLFALYRIGYHSKATVHGFRALFSTIANETGWNPDAIERQLAHKEKDAIRAAYHRSEYMQERTQMMQWWADHLHHLEHGADIVPIGKKAAAGE
ncbi:MAG: tyrosine-type recombinase/integrase [Desulfobulbus sp.]|nr:tyrosine-type recombinase/integrase [Desulfobulbus sp.]